MAVAMLILALSNGLLVAGVAYLVLRWLGKSLYGWVKGRIDDYRLYQELKDSPHRRYREDYPHDLDYLKPWFMRDFRG